MEKGKIIIPIISLLAIAGIITVIVLTTSTGFKKFELPSKVTVEDDIKALGYDIGNFDMKEYKVLGLNSNYVKIWAKYNDKEKNDGRDVSISYMNYDSIEDAQKAFDNFFVAAQYTDKKTSHDGKIKYYQNNEKMTGYILYNATVDSKNFIDDYAMAMTNEDSLFNPKSDFIYGGIYMKGKTIVYATTSERSKISTINNLLDKYELPKP